MRVSRKNTKEQAEGNIDQEEAGEINSKQQYCAEVKQRNRKEYVAPEGVKNYERDAELKPDGELIERLPGPPGQVFQRPSEKRGAFAVTIKVGQCPRERGLGVEAEP